MSGALVTRGAVLAGQYQDSVWLMRASEALRARDGIEAVGVVMGTPRNLEMIDEADLRFDGIERATPNDIVVAVRGEAGAVEQALADAPRVVQKPAGSSGGRSFSSLRAAIAAAGDAAGLALVSVNGEYAADEAREALEAGLDVMIFSDNVAVADEVALKRRAAELGRLVMGPDCGTAILSGVGLGFANEVPRGPVGIVAASGTGAQAVSTLLAARGVGVSHLIGLGGRDLEDEVGGLTLAGALAALDADAQTEAIVLVAKKTGKRVFADLLAAAAGLSKPLVTCLLGPGSWWVVELVGATAAHSLADAAAKAAALVEGRAQRPVPAGLARAAAWRERLGEGRTLQGRFAGGTLAQEALDVAGALLGPVRANLGAAKGVESPHVLLDLGDDEYTTNAPHPMINPAQQAEQLRDALADPATGVVLFDVVIGHGSHEDPAGVLAPAIADGLAAARAEGRTVHAVCSVCGTEGDPQRRSRQVERLAAAGATVLETNAEAALLAALAVAPAPAAAPAAAPALLGRPMRTVVNVGSSWFADALAAQDVDVVHVDWRPPAQGDAGLRDLLKALG
ncbi:MAG TPA: acyl-CoA synthetase FdrA [Conexibacter sp.]|nr:acyl-CoA synthetase FdrA [Conexibacter sp.]